jgi:hypothetical protein
LIGVTRPALMETSTVWYGADKQISSRNQIVVFPTLMSVVSLGAIPYLLCFHLFSSFMRNWPVICLG